MPKLITRSDRTPLEEDLIYLINGEATKDGKYPLSGLTELPSTSNITLSFTSSQTRDEIQAEIDDAPRYIRQGNILTLSFADGTYNLNGSLEVGGFYGGGQIQIQGNTGETNGLYTSQAVHLNFNNDSHGIHFHNSPGISLCIIEHLKITVGDAYIAVWLNREGNSRVRYNYLIGGGTTDDTCRGIYCVFGHNCQATNNYVNNFRHGLYAHFLGIISSQNNDDTGTQPAFGLRAARSGTIGKNGTQPAGSSANESASNGGEIRA